MTFNKSKRAAVLLNLLVPGLGHLYWKEYLFGVFIFLVMLIAVILFILSFFITVNKSIFWIVGTLPLIFYLFTFIDLLKTIKKKKVGFILSPKLFIYFLAAGLIYQLFSPIAPLNFFFRNRPEIYTVKQNNLSPLFLQGNLLMANPLAYKVDLFFIEKPILFDIPDRYQPVRFKTEDGRMKTGLVLGLPNEEIEIAEGVVVINGYPDYEDPPGNLILLGECQLTSVEPYSILVATLNLGAIDKIYMVSFADLTGKVTKIF